jgi:hypothetical protein
LTWAGDGAGAWAWVGDGAGGMPGSVPASASGEEPGGADSDAGAITWEGSRDF